ncbi:MAG: glycosyltransferase family 2 protein [Hellea sp.]|nr:glycosyltransferase family 2 protein [Hellea sp.]
MNPIVDIKQFASLAKLSAKPSLSILVPYYHDNPVPLIQALAQECSERTDVEILIYDDGSGDPGLSCDVIAAVKNSAARVRLYIAEQNCGRSFARNQLFSRAKSDWVLFLDADMRPETDHFVTDYVDLIARDNADIIFGGFKVIAKSDDPDRELHRALSEVSDCLTLEQRRIAGPQYVCSSNLAVRKSVMIAEPFDPDFSGWGWEDSEWAARVSKKFCLLHADIPALHVGLETTETLLSRFQSSGPNYLLFTHKHPDLAQALPLYRIVQKLRKVPGQKFGRPLLRAIVKLRFAPVKIRLIALKLWRASWYAETFA